MENLCYSNLLICHYTYVYLLLLRGDKLVGGCQSQCPNSEVIRHLLKPYDLLLWSPGDKIYSERGLGDGKAFFLPSHFVRRCWSRVDDVGNRGRLSSAKLWTQKKEWMKEVKRFLKREENSVKCSELRKGVEKRFGVAK